MLLIRYGPKFVSGYHFREPRSALVSASLRISLTYHVSSCRVALTLISTDLCGLMILSSTECQSSCLPSLNAVSASRKSGSRYLLGVSIETRARGRPTAVIRIVVWLSAYYHQSCASDQTTGPQHDGELHVLH